MERELWPAPRRATPIRATLSVPGSKSATNRALILSALADAPSRLSQPLRSRDTGLMAEGLRALGVLVTDEDADWLVQPQNLTGPARIDVGNAGTVMRFLPALATLAEGAISFDGDPRAYERPVRPIIEALRTLGAEIDDGGLGRLPFTIHGDGGLRGGEVTIDASSSSQFVSALLLIGARTSDGITIRHRGGAIPSQPHIRMTISMLAESGVRVHEPEANVWHVPPQPIHSHNVDIEPDLSNAAAFMAAAMVTKGEVIIRHWPRHTDQAGDRLRNIFVDMGAEVAFVEPGLKIIGRSLHGIDQDLNDVGELTPVIAALCALADSPSHLSGIAHLRLHETDRLAALATEINGLGGNVSETNDGLVIRPQPLHGGTFHTYDDHRLATAGAVLGLAVDGIQVENIATTMKTIPDFSAMWDELLRG